MAKANKCPVRREQVIDSGPFTTKAAKAGITPVKVSFVPDGTATASLPFAPSKETKKGVCVRLKGGGEAKCRVQITAAPDRSSLALRLCKAVETPGFILPVADAVEAQKKGHEFCACKETKGAEACAKEMGAELEPTKAPRAPRPKVPQSILGLEAIKDIKVGRKTKTTPASVVFNYSHVLPSALRTKGFSLIVEELTEGNAMIAAVRHPKAPVYPKLRRGEVGSAGALLPLNSDSVDINTSWVEEPYRGKGLGPAMYEALLAHAYHRHGRRRVVGGSHSTMAMRVHQKLAAKHGLQYEPRPNYGPNTSNWETKKEWDEAFTGENDEKYLSYDYPLAGVADQFPKTCKVCGNVIADRQTWDALQLIGEQKDEYERIELRNCRCGTTLALITDVYKADDGGLGGARSLDRYRFTVSVGKKRDGSIDYVTAGAFWLDTPGGQDDRVGSVNFSYYEDGYLIADDVWVHDSHRRQGIAKRMYEEVERQTGLAIRPSDLQTQQGASFWRGGRKA